MGRLALTFYLGRPLIPVAASLASALGQRLGVAVAFDPAASDGERRAALETPPAGIVWMCGLETVLRQADGRLGTSIIGAPVFPGRGAPVYDSVIVARPGWTGTGLTGLDRATLAINEPESWSGHHALRAHLRRIAPSPAVARVVVTGSHDASIDALVGGTADVAAIDETVWTARLAGDPEAAVLRVLDRTEAWPAPPFSVTHGLDRGLASAVREALPAVAVTGLEAIMPAKDEDYAVFHDGLASSMGLGWATP